MLFIANTYPHWTGTDAGALMIIRRLAQRGHAITVLQTWSSILERQLGDIPGVTLVEARGDDMFFKHKWHGWVAPLWKHRADVCVLNKGWYLMRHEWIDIGARLGCGRYVAVENHPAVSRAEKQLRGIKWLKYRAAFGLHYTLLDDVIAISRAVLDILHQGYWLPRRKGQVVPLGIDLDLNQFDAAGRQRIRQQLGLDETMFVFGAVGRLAPEKGFDRLLPQFAELTRRVGQEHLRLVLAGTGEHTALLKQSVRDLGISDQVLLPGWIDTSDRVPFLSALDCFVMPSRVEGLGLALLEAMACERPCIGTDAGGVSEILTEPGIGWLIERDAMNEFGAAMLIVSRLSAPERAAVGEQARAHVGHHFERRRQVDRLVDAILGPFAAT